MSLETLIAVDVELPMLDICIKSSREESGGFGSDDRWFIFHETSDYYRSFFDKKYIYEIEDGSYGEFYWSYSTYIRAKNLQKEDSEFYNLNKSHGIDEEKYCYSHKIMFERFFEYIRQVIPKGSTALVYTIYNNEPNFIPKERVEIDLQTFVLPDEFGFDEDVLYTLQN